MLCWCFIHALNLITLNSYVWCFVFVDMDQNHLIVVIKVIKAYIDLLIILANFAKWLTEHEERHMQRRTLRQRTFTRYQIRSIEIQRITCESDIICVNEL